MAKKRGSGGGGSNMGLIITLVFFVLATLILGVTTYFGFADQEANRKAKDDAIKLEKKREEERNWYRFQVRVLRQWMAQPPAGLDAKDLAREKADFDKGRLNYANTQTDKDDVVKLFKEMDKTMLWDANKEDVPLKTYQTRLEEKDKQVVTLSKAADQLKKEKEEFERQATEARTALAEEKKMFETKIAQVTTNVKDDLKKVRDQIDALQTALQTKGKEKADETLAHAETSKKLDTAEKGRRGLETKLASATKDVKSIREQLDETSEKLRGLADKTGTDLDSIERAKLDSKVRELLKGWNKDWSVVLVDRRGSMPYINLGSADGLTPQVTFSIHAAGSDGRLNPTPKGTMEVVRVVGPHMAQARVTSVRDSRADPILKGDRLFNPTWDPTRKRRVALAGIADLGGEGTDNTQDFRQMLSRQGVLVDAYIDTKDDKTPKLVGRGISTNTDYLVLAESLDAVQHPKARDKVYAQAFDRLMVDMKAKANASGVTMISLRRYLDMIGYRAPKVVSSNPDVAGYAR